jgi:hypothetical protein
VVRALRLSWHADSSAVHISLWIDRVCVGSFRLKHDDVDRLAFALLRGLNAETSETATKSGPRM